MIISHTPNWSIIYDYKTFIVKATGVEIILAEQSSKRAFLETWKPEKNLPSDFLLGNCKICFVLNYSVINMNQIK
jgi:hypothetical protein